MKNNFLLIFKNQYFRFYNFLLLSLIWSSLGLCLESNTQKNDLPISTMQMILKKTFLAVRVLQIEINFDAKTSNDIQKIIETHEKSEKAYDLIVKTIFSASDVRVTGLFLHDVTFNQFISESLTSTRCAQKAGYLVEAEFKKIEENLPIVFHPLKERGIEKGDFFVYHITSEGLQTVFTTHQSNVLVNDTKKEGFVIKALLGGYFAPCSEFRNDLLNSLQWRK